MKNCQRWQVGANDRSGNSSETQSDLLKRSIDDRLPQAVRLGEFDYDNSMASYVFSTVPEPSAILLALFAAGTAITWRRK